MPRPLSWLSTEPCTTHYLEATNRPHWSSISVLYFRRCQRWPIFNQLRANVACFLADDRPIWYPYRCEQLSHLNRRPALRLTALGRIERGVVVSAAPPPLFGTYPKQKHDHIVLLELEGAKVPFCKVAVIRPI